MEEEPESEKNNPKVHNGAECCWAVTEEENRLFSLSAAGMIISNDSRYRLSKKKKKEGGRVNKGQQHTFSDIHSWNKMVLTRASAAYVARHKDDTAE